MTVSTGSTREDILRALAEELGLARAIEILQADRATTAPDAGSPLDPHCDYMLLADVAVDVVAIRRPVEDELATGDGVTLKFLRYGGDDRQGLSRPCAPPIILPRARIRTGLYIRGPVPFDTRMDVDDEGRHGRGLIVRVVLRERARVRVYAKTTRGRIGASGKPTWVDDIIVMTERLPKAVSRGRRATVVASPGDS